jgi:pyridoxal phosphate-dependent aminotransferase EpsN
MVSKRIYLSPPHMSDEGYEMDYIKEAFDTNWIAPLGPNVDSFEKEICDYVKIKSAVALSSGTAAVHLALRYLGVGNNDYVFCSSLTFAGSCNPIIYQGAIPVFIDSETESWNISPLALEEAFHWAKKENKMPKTIIITDLYGQSADYEKLLPICNHYKVPVIEDSAEALGATYRNKKCGTFGYINVFSFNGNKIVTTSGGGMAVSDDEDAIKKMRFWATQAREPEIHYEHKEIGYNYRISNICAGIGRGQLMVLNRRIIQKKTIYEKYKKAFLKIKGIEMMPIAIYGEPNYWLSVITIKKGSSINPIDVIMQLEKNNIESRPVWKPMNLQPYYKKYNFFNHQDKDMSVSEDIFNRGLCLPSGTEMTEEKHNIICNIINDLF